MARLPFISLLSLSLQLITMISHVLGQDAPLMIQGGLEGATADDDTYNTGGTISLNGFSIAVPRNLLVEFPAAYVPWKDFVADQDAMIGYEIMVLGNFMNGVPIAAQVQAYQFFEQLSSGFIESVNFTDGSMKIAAGPTLRISDPNAVFSVGYAGAPFFTADDESPSISSFSGFPMCIPRNESDPLCPSTNRPFQGSGTFTAPDPLSMAPFLPGDFVTYSGARRGNEMICFSIVAQNVQITTLQDLVYIRMDLGLLGIDNFNTNTELKESRFVGYTSNARATIALYALDYDPCTGEPTDRLVAAVGLRNGRNEQNKWEYRADITQGYARDYRAVAEIDGVPKTRSTKMGLIAGTYVQPVNVWVQAEQLTPGTPPPANDFSQLSWLTQGVGVDVDGNLWGPLDPFPQSGILIEPPNCGAVSALTFKGDVVKTDFVPSSSLMNGTSLAANGTVSGTSSNSTVALSSSTTTSAAAVINTDVAASVPVPTAQKKRKRGVPSARWSTRARIDAITPPGDDPNLVQITAPQPE